MATSQRNETIDAGSDRKSQPEDGDISELPMQRNVDEDESSPRSIHGVKWAIAYASILSSTFLFALDNTVVADVQPAIVNRFGEMEDLPWLGVAYALGGIALLPWGKAYGIFNIKRLYLTSVLIFEAGSALCGAAPSMNALIIGRVIAGLGGNGMYTGCLTYIAVTTSTSERPLYMSGVTVLWGGGTVLGPLVGGAFTDSPATWRWAFYLNLVIGALFAPALLWILPGVDLKPSTSFIKKTRMMDWLAILVFFGGTLSFTMALNFGGTIYAWNSGSEITLWVITGLLLVTFILVTHYHPFVSKADRLYPFQFYRRFELANLQLQAMLTSGIILTTAYYIPLYFQFARGDDALQAAVRLLPFVSTLVFSSLVNGACMPRLGYHKPWYLIGSGLDLIGCALMYTVNQNTPTSRVYGYTVLMGLGSGAFLMAGFPVVEHLVGVSDLSNAVSFMAIAQDIGIMLLLALAGSIYQNVTTARLMPVLARQQQSSGVTQSSNDVALLLTGTSNSVFRNLQPVSLREEVVSEITQGIRGVWALLLAGAALSFFATIFLGNRRIYGQGGLNNEAGIDGGAGVGERDSIGYRE